MKDIVIQFFKSLPKQKSEQFNEALSLFKEASKKNDGQFRFYNKAGYTKANLDNLLYDLKKRVNITDADIRKAKKVISEKVVVAGFTTDTNLSEKSLTELFEFLTSKEMEVEHFPKFDEGEIGNAQMIEFCKEYDIETTSNDSNDILAVIQKRYREYLTNLVTEFFKAESELKKALASVNVLSEHQLGENFNGTPVLEEKQDVFTKAPDDVKEAIKFKDEFPFLLDKDCPEEFHILTGQKFAAFYAWKKAHGHLLVNIKDTDKDASPIAMSEEEVSEMALAAVEDFEVNQAIWKELNHYKTTGKILGKHPIFIERNLKESVDNMTIAQASKRLSNLDNYIRRDKRKLEAAEKSKIEKDVEKFSDKVLKWETEEKLIKAKHNL